MSSPKRAAKTVVKAAAKPAPRAVAVLPAAAKPAVAAGNGVSAEATRLAAEIERGIVDGKLDVLTTEALQKLLGGGLPGLHGAHRSRRALHAGAQEFDFRHRRDGHGERIVTSRRSRRLRTRHVAELDGALELPSLRGAKRRSNLEFSQQRSAGLLRFARNDEQEMKLD